MLPFAIQRLQARRRTDSSRNPQAGHGAMLCGNSAACEQAVKQPDTIKPVGLPGDAIHVGFSCRAKNGHRDQVG